MYDVCLIMWAGLALVGILTMARNPDYVEKEKAESRKIRIEGA